MLPPDGTGAQIKLDKKNDATFAAYVVEAKITPGASGGLWQACLAPQQGSAGTFTVTATCTMTSTLFWTVSLEFLSSLSPHTRRVTCAAYTQYPGVLCTD